VVQRGFILLCPSYNRLGFFQRRKRYCRLKSFPVVPSFAFLYQVFSLVKPEYPPDVIALRFGGRAITRAAMILKK